MTVPIWVQGVLIAVLGGIKLLWGLDMVVTYVVRRARPGVWRRGAVALGIYNIATSALYVLTAWAWLRMPEQERPIWVLLLITAITVPAVLAWVWLPQDGERGEA